MAISFVGSLPTVGANNGGNVTLTFSNLVDSAGAAATLQQGDVVVCAYASSGTADAAMSTSSAGWTEVHENYANGTSNDTNLALYYKVMGASPDTSFVAVGPTGNSNGTIGVAMAFRGVDPAVLDIAFVAGSHAAAGTATTRPNPPSINPSGAGAWPVVVGAGAAAAGAAFTNPGDLSSTTNHFRSGNHAETIDIAIGMGFKTDWTSGAFDPAQFTGGVSNAGDSWAAIVIALKAGLTGTLSTTLDDLTGSSAGTVQIKAAASPTLGALASSSSATIQLKASATPTLEALGLSSAAAIQIKASASQSLEPLSATGTGALLAQGTAAVTLDALSCTSFGAVQLKSAVAPTLEALALSSAATVGGAAISGAMAQTLAGLSLGSTADLAISGAAAVSLSELTVLALGVGGIEPIIHLSATIVPVPLPPEATLR